MNRPDRRLQFGVMAGFLVLGGLLPPSAARPGGASSTVGTAAGTGTGSHAIGESGGFGPGRWVATWGASPQLPVPGTRAAAGFDDQTVRNIVFTSVGGSAVRLKLTNAFGASTLAVGHVTIGVAGSGAAIVPGTLRSVTFGGGRSAEIPPGAEEVSDPVAMRVRPLQDLAISVYLPNATGPATTHWYARQVNWVSAPGDHAAQTGAAAFTEQSQSWYFLDQVAVRSPRAAGTVIAVGDSITDGYTATVGANTRWPNDLARRLDAVPGRTLAVIDEGISGNRLLTGDVCCGTGAVARFSLDVAGQPGARDVILFEGINDIGFSTLPPSPFTDPNTDVSADKIIAGDQQIIAAAHARGLKIFGATLTPFEHASYFTAAGERKREAVNDWIRTSAAFDGVIDFDRVVRDPGDPLMINPVYDAGDHLHPNDAGYQAMANAISLDMLRDQAGM